VRQLQISVVRATTYKMAIVQDTAKILVGLTIIFSNVRIAFIRVAVEDICSMRIPKNKRRRNNIRTRFYRYRRERNKI
jgi:multisubunit Na+/H+ antiporter MnhC subunit